MSKQRKFEVGDRVAADWPDGIDVQTQSIRKYTRVRGKFGGYTSDGKAMVDGYCCAPNSLAHLKKKERRMVWIRERDIPAPLRSGSAIISSGELLDDTYIEFIEVKRK